MSYKQAVESYNRGQGNKLGGGERGWGELQEGGEVGGELLEGHSELLAYRFLHRATSLTIKSQGNIYHIFSTSYFCCSEFFKLKFQSRANFPFLYFVGLYLAHNKPCAVMKWPPHFLINART